jgi:hypothetical protein
MCEKNTVKDTWPTREKMVYLNFPGLVLLKGGRKPREDDSLGSFS